MALEQRTRQSDNSFASSSSSIQPESVSSATDEEDTIGDVVRRGNQFDEQRVQSFKDQILQILVEKQFPLEQSEIIVKSFESKVTSKVRATFVTGTRIHEVLDGYAEPKVGITFLAGADAPQVNRIEGAGMTESEPDQKDASWRVDTAGALLKNFEVDKHMGVSETDNTYEVVQKVRQRCFGVDSSTYEQNSARAVAKRTRDRETQADTTVTIDSDNVRIVNDLSEGRWDLECTLIEVDQSSLMDLLVNYQTLIHGIGPALTINDTNALLDTMIEDARRLCLRSPILFRMSTRRRVIWSKNTRYGVDQGTQFQTLTTSSGIKNLIEVSASYFNSLASPGTKDKSKELVRPRFLQMIVLLLAMLNEDDLQQIARFLEVTYKFRAERQHIELLILKVLPLMSINSEIFVDSLVAAVDGPNSNPSLNDQPHIWKRFVERRLHQGYILPGTMEQIRDSWVISWSENGIEDSSVFNHLQYAGDASKHGGGRTINDIPPLNLHASYSDEEITVILRDTRKYITTNVHLESIIRMSRGSYPVTEAGEGQRTFDLNITEATPSEPIAIAMAKMNSILNIANRYLAAPRQQNALSRALSIRSRNERRIAPNLFPVLKASGRLTVNVASLNGKELAVAYKVDGRKITRRDLVRNLTTDMAKLRNTGYNLQTVLQEFSGKRISTEFQQHLASVRDGLLEIDNLVWKAEQHKAGIEKWDPRLADEPVARVIRPIGADQTSNPVWHAYRADASPPNQLCIKAEQRVVREVTWTSDDIIEVFFKESPVKYFVSPLRPVEEYEREPELRPGERVQLVGNYILVGEPNKLASPISPVSPVVPVSGQPRPGYGRTLRVSSAPEAHELPTEANMDYPNGAFEASPPIGGYAPYRAYNTPDCLMPGRRSVNRIPVGRRDDRIPIAEPMVVVNWLKITGIEQQTVNRRRSQQPQAQPHVIWEFM